MGTCPRRQVARPTTRCCQKSVSEMTRLAESHAPTAATSAARSKAECKSRSARTSGTGALGRHGSLALLRPAWFIPPRKDQPWETQA